MESGQEIKKLDLKSDLWLVVNLFDKRLIRPLNYEAASKLNIMLCCTCMYSTLSNSRFHLCDVMNQDPHCLFGPESKLPGFVLLLSL